MLQESSSRRTVFRNLAGGEDERRGEGEKGRRGEREKGGMGEPKTSNQNQQQQP